MKIVVNTRVLLPDQLEGVGKFTHEILWHLVGQHPEHEFYFLFDRPYHPQFIYGPNVKPLVIYPPARHPFLFYLWFQGMVPRVLRQLKADVFLSMDNMTSLRTQVPRVTVIHDLAYLHFPEEKKYLDRRYYERFIPQFAAASRAILTVSEFTKADVVQQLGVAPQKIQVTPCGVSNFFKPTAYAQQIEIRQKYCAGEMYFVFVGALQPRKNLANVFKAFDFFKNLTRSEVKLVIVGRKAWKAQSILKAYRQMEHKADVVFTGRVSDAEVRQLYGSALGLVFPSIFEGFGLPIIEAQKCHCPVITSNTSSMPEVAGNSALLVNPLLPDEIGEALMQLYHYPDKREALIRLGQQNCQRYSWSHSAQLVYQKLEEAVQTPNISVKYG
ncbi:glycosyltransferase family 4 protein [Adhaeribacter swui]|uniref:Glycosyltransferase family 4 protein n=1 Tax=Adhaeribacter swui TaxID=2086471 RepID=A0A7G7GBX1_9BACT|nr:glycosyltransferase family 1 protein [Adhaeribacter swui]QNF34655.1 glycosyltransferase family 4 protein [Adhaeribacter swui]